MTSTRWRLVKNWDETGRLGCHSRAGGNPVFSGFSRLPPEFTPAKAEAGVTIEMPLHLPIKRLSVSCEDLAV
jgi:hypothetical protein